MAASQHSTLKTAVLASAAATVPAFLLAYVYRDHALGTCPRRDLPSPAIDPVIGHLRYALQNYHRLQHMFLQCW